MGYGDYIHWTAVIRDLYKYINTGTIEERINKINQFKIGNKNMVLKNLKRTMILMILNFLFLLKMQIAHLVNKEKQKKFFIIIHML